MIEMATENVVSLLDAVKHLPRRRRGKRPHVSTLYRWAQSGIGDVKLEVIRVGGTLCTSLESLQRFCEHLTDGSAPPSHITPKKRQREIDRAERDLERAGI